MNRTQFVQLEIEGLVLRRLKNSDWEMISYLRSDKEVNKFVKRPSAESKEKALGFILKINGGIDKGDSLYWVISKKDSDEMLGSICLWNFSRDRKTAEIGYDLSPEYQGRGIMNACVAKILDFGFISLHLELIEAFTHGENESSTKLLKRNGFKLILGKTDAHNENNLIFGVTKTRYLKLTSLGKV